MVGGSGVNDKISVKPLGYNSYGSIPHLPGSRVGPGDHKCHEGQARIATIRTRDKYDQVICQEKLDGSNVCVAKVNGVCLALGRSGYLASTSPFEMHHKFDEWVTKNYGRFDGVLREGERLCGEWLYQAHGTRYNLPHEPLVVFDLMVGTTRFAFDDFLERIGNNFVAPALLHRGNAIDIEQALHKLGEHGYHGAIDQAEGAVWRVERKGKVDFLVKFVRPDKVDGKYLPEISGMSPVYNSF